MIKTQFGFSSTAAEVAEGVDLTDLASVDAFVRAWDGPLHGVARYAVDPDNAARLWTYSETLLAKA
ncbi:hypothetical protein [Lentzea californiensis]|uniref:hypothetical protein n=1 Tax=Lentzea californiensis TaxID=438851 RepID=UPI0021658B28|nr:hypothetical protein [Lentzea californiensis]MCR3752969.1 hypothetical protein [Lentzea californiensis]